MRSVRPAYQLAGSTPTVLYIAGPKKQIRGVEEAPFRVVDWVLRHGAGTAMCHPGNSTTHTVQKNYCNTRGINPGLPLRPFE
jgi:hypothetical protein